MIAWEEDLTEDLGAAHNFPRMINVELPDYAS